MSKLTKGAALATVCGLLISAPAFAKHDEDGSWEYAKVVSVEPIYREVRVSAPHQECHEEPVVERTVYPAHPDPGAVLIGGIIGGVIGHQFGGGSGKHVATAAGAVIGSQTAARHSYHPQHVVERTVVHTTCRTVHQTRYEDRIDGYEVTYKYHGRLYTTRTPYHPGKRIKVRMDVAPAGYDLD